MSRDKLILSGVVLLGVLAALVYRQARKDEALGRPTMTATDFPSVSTSDDVDKISITNGDKGEVILQKVSDPKGEATDAGPAMKWVLTKPVSADANQQAVKDILGNLKDIKVESQINLKLDDDVRKEKQLDSSKGVHVVAWKGTDKKLDDLFGKSGTAGQLVVVADKPDLVWAARGYSAYLYTKEPKDFRDKEIFKFDDATAATVTITNAHGTLVFTKGDNWTGTYDKRPIARLDQEKVKDMLRAYKALSADDFGDGKGLADTGLDKPDATVAIHLTADGGKNYDLSIGKVSTGTNRWAKRSTDDAIYQITSYAADWGLAETSKFQSPADAGAPDASKNASKKK
jgi:hypothetical protein